MKLLLIGIFLLGGFAGQVSAGKHGDELLVEDVVGSTKRIQHAFTTKPEKNSVLEQGISVGETSRSNTEFYITYRPSLGLEILRCIDRSCLPLAEIGLELPGHGHKGLTQLFSKEDIQKTIITPFMQYKQDTQIPSEQITVFVDGMSAGAHRAVETALYLKQHQDTKDHSMIVLRYGDAKTFDSLAVDSIHKLLGKENIISFHARGDKIVEFMDIPEGGASLGTRVEFSAADSLNYRARVKNRVYTSLEPILKPLMSRFEDPWMKSFAEQNLAGLGIPPETLSFLTTELWELHQPITYAELCPYAFAKFKEKK